MFGMYARRRLAALALSATLLVGGLRYTTPSHGAGRPTPYAVRAADTLWSIAATRYGGDPRAAVDAIERANRMSSELVRPGQVLMLPDGV